MKVDVYVATHKKIDYAFPSYCKKIQVNCSANGHFPGYLYDDVPDGGISEKNSSYCELTALYTLWKNSDAEIKGLYHYRRFLSNAKPLKTCRDILIKHEKDVAKSCLTEKQIVDILQDYDVIDAMPYGPYPLKEREFLPKFCFPHDIEIMDEVIRTKYPDYWESYQQVMDSDHISHFNMLITKAEILDQYCTWLFSVLADCEERIDISTYDTKHKRVYGYFTEVLLNVYLRCHHLREKHVVTGFVYEQFYQSKSQRVKMSLLTFVYSVAGRIGIPLPTKQSKRVQHYNKTLAKNE